MEKHLLCAGSQKTQLSNTANCLKPQKGADWARTACGFLVIQGHGGRVGTFPLALSDKYIKTALQHNLA